MFRGKKYQESAKQIDRAALYDTNEAMELIVKTAPAKFDETVELHVKLGVDSRHADQQVRGAIVLPHGTGKTQRVLVFAKAAKADEAKAAGADYVGEMDLVEKIQKENWFDFDVVVATPDMMGVVGRLGKVLGPKGLMPSPKAGTVTMDVTKAVNEIKAGKVEYRLDLLHGLGHVGGDGAGLGGGHQALGAQDLTEAAHQAHHVGAGNNHVKVEPVFRLDLLHHIHLAHVIRAGLPGSVGLVALGEHQDPDGLAGAVGQHDGAADLLVSVTGVHAQLHMELNGLVKLGAGSLADQRHAVSSVVQHGLVDLLGTFLIFLASKQCYFLLIVVLRK